MSLLPLKRDTRGEVLADGQLVLDRPIWNRIWATLVLVVVLVLSAGYLTERVITERKLQDLKVSAIDNLATVRAKLEGVVNANMMLVRGLVGEIVYRPDISQEEFANFVHYLMGEDSQLRNIGAAPDMVISLMYPLKGNEAAVGLDYRTHPQQREAAMRVINTGDPVIAGPVNLVQGGQGFIARVPVFLPSIEQMEERRVWGIVSAVMDVEKVYQAAGLTDKTLPLEIAIRGKDGQGKMGDLFYGDDALFEDDFRVTQEVTLPAGSWQLAATPKGGWIIDERYKLWILLGTLLVALLLASLTFFWMSNYERRKVVERVLRKQQQELEVQVTEKTADLKSAKESAERANMIKSSFLANMSHELRTPMHAILSFSSMGIRKMDSLPREKLHKFFGNIHQSGERLLLLLDDLLDLAKLEAGRMELEQHQHDLKKVVEIGVKEFNELAKVKSLKLNLEQSDADLVIAFDQNKILQVVRNLLSNAIKFSPNECVITIAFAQGELMVIDSSGLTKVIDAVSFTVSDEGDGIPEDEFDTVFDKFIQSSKTRTGGGGTGLGLAICKEIVELHGGEIRSGNNQQGGAIFSVILPRAM